MSFTNPILIVSKTELEFARDQHLAMFGNCFVWRVGKEDLPCLILPPSWVMAEYDGGSATVPTRYRIKPPWGGEWSIPPELMTMLKTDRCAACGKLLLDPLALPATLFGLEVKTYCCAGCCPYQTDKTDYVLGPLS